MTEPAGTTEPVQSRAFPRWAKALIWVVVILAAIVLLFTVVFPWVDEVLNSPTLGASALPLRV